MTSQDDWPARALDAARGWIGTPYRHGASCKGAGADCLGLVRGVWVELHGRAAEAPPAYSPLWAEETGAELLLTALQRHMGPLEFDEAGPGDVLAFRFTPWAPVKHVAVLSTDGRMIHAYSGHEVAETTLGPWWRRRRAAAFRFGAVLTRDPKAQPIIPALSRNPEPRAKCLPLLGPGSRRPSGGLSGMTDLEDAA